jgi:hypothetical protein
MKPFYEVVPAYQKRLFREGREGRVVYKLVKNYQYWDDPSYGNGGGDYRDARICIHTFHREDDALSAMTALNKIYEVVE